LQPFLEGERVKAPRRGEGAHDHRIGHAMVQRVEEADILAGMPRQLGGAVESAGLAGEAGPEIDDRDLRRGRGIIFDALLLKQIHRGSLGFAAVDYKPSAPALPGAVLTGSSF